MKTKLKCLIFALTLFCAGMSINAAPPTNMYPWNLEYIPNEWGESDYSRPFIYTILDGTSWNLNIEYVIPSEAIPTGFFIFSIVDDDGHKENSYSPVNIFVRGSDGETKSVKVAQTTDGYTLVSDPLTVAALRYYFDRENFDIRMEFGKWNEEHSTRAFWSCRPGAFMQIVNSLIR